VKASRTFLFIFLIMVSLCLVNTQPVMSQSSGTIYIRSDGSVEGTDKIQRDGNVYTLTDNVDGSIVVEKDNIVIDGAGCTLQGTGSGKGTSLTSRSNVTIKNTEINNFGIGVHLIGSSNNSIYGNRITNNGDGVFITDLWLGTYGIGSSNNSIVGNNITLSSGNVTLNSGCGVKITRWSNQNTVSGNIIERNGDGIYVGYFSNNTVIIDNNVTLNDRYGIHIDYYSDDNIIIGNHIANNGWKGPDTTKPPFLIWCGGIRIYRSINNTLRNNQMVNNMYNFELLYIFVSDFINDIDTSNTVNGKPIYHWIGERDRTVPSDAGYVALINCLNITVKNLNLANNKDGILITSTKNSIITGNRITNCIAGIYLDHSSTGVAGTVLGPPSSGIVICENNIMNNDYGIRLGNARENTIYRNNLIINNIGIYFDESKMNEIYHNNFINNTDQVKFNGFYMPPFAPARINTWDNGYPSGGNYWSNYKEKYPNATELNGSDIWNTPYVIAVENKDEHPLMNPVTVPEFSDTTPPFPTTLIVAAIVVIAVVGAALLVCFVKVKKTTGEAKE